MYSSKNVDEAIKLLENRTHEIQNLKVVAE